MCFVVFSKIMLLPFFPHGLDISSCSIGLSSEEMTYGFVIPPYCLSCWDLLSTLCMSYGYGHYISLYQEMKLDITERKKMYRHIFSSKNLYVRLLENKSSW